ncbi:MAG: diguanylate cyclase [Armatimonadota bacterium]|nr:diguanylate cyclase [Armatimonadota bacterium]
MLKKIFHHYRFGTTRDKACACGAAAVLTFAAIVLSADLRLFSESGFLPMLLGWALLGLFETPSSTFRPASPLRFGLGRRQAQVAEAYRATIETLASAISAQDPFERYHVQRVRAISELVAREMGLSAREVEGIQIAALLHDIGKLGVPSYILMKPSQLDPEEFAKIANHAAIGAQMLEGINYPWNVAQMVRHHHERYDGSGYPDGISGADIPLGARIIAVAEVYDGLVSTRCYKAGWPHYEVVAHIEKLSGIHFDPAVVAAFARVNKKIEALIDVYPTSTQPECANTDPKSVRAVDLISQAKRELLSLLEIADTLSTTLELDEVTALLAHRSRRLTEAATCVVFLVDESDPSCLVAQSVVGRHKSVFEGARARLGRGVTGKAASRMRPYLGSYDPNDLQLVRRVSKGLQVKSCLVVPMVCFGRLVGTINLYDDSSSAFSKDDLATMESIAGRAAYAIQNALAFESVRQSATRDPLTGLYNTRYLHTYLERELNRASRRNGCVSLLQLDLDNFKPVNDTFGHARGDEVLKDLAKIFLDCVRSYDVVCRCGGDEFIIVLPDSSAREAARTARRIQDAVELYAGQKLGGCSVPLGVSIGIATYPQDAVDSDGLIARADEAMYQNKRARKNVRTAA